MQPAFYIGREFMQYVDAGVDQDRVGSRDEDCIAKTALQRRFLRTKISRVLMIDRLHRKEHAALDDVIADVRAEALAVWAPALAPLRAVTRLIDPGTHRGKHHVVDVEKMLPVV